MSPRKQNQQVPALESVDEAIEKAYDMVSALCRPRGSQGSREWIMSIPARPDHDPDLVIAAGLRAASVELRKLRALELNHSGACERLKQERDEARQFAESLRDDAVDMRLSPGETYPLPWETLG